MQFKSFFAVLAAGLSMVAAQGAEEDITTTQTSTLTQTQTVTITQCNPTVSNCPGFVASSTETTTSTVTSWTFPLSNSSSTVGPTAVYSSKATLLTSRPVITQTSFVDVPGASSTGSGPASSSPATAGAGSLFIQPAILLGVLGAGVALLA
ncbi:hypothetical protein QBC35DRAFT_301118 [Podospora australis]|uniref:Uncharacterized protein n=1 Tax=Podospora australis TaxID=1536484 RepID=A0AAN6WP39_9PEZI|nr:hypothetical protein QBC35DRAFT_301118 [Podospora australis]